VIIDIYAAYPADEKIRKKMPPSKFVVTKKDLLYEIGALPVRQVEKYLAKIIEGRLVVMHGGQLDQQGFFFEHKAWEKCPGMFDTQDLYSGTGGKNQPGLAECAARHLSARIQVTGTRPWRMRRRLCRSTFSSALLIARRRLLSTRFLFRYRRRRLRRWSSVVRSGFSLRLPMLLWISATTTTTVATATVGVVMARGTMGKRSTV